jgi:hypothetical protein
MSTKQWQVIVIRRRCTTKKTDKLLSSGLILKRALMVRFFRLCDLFGVGNVGWCVEISKYKYWEL